MKIFTEEFKKSVVQKYLSRGSRTVAEICSETGVTGPTIYDWVKKYGIISPMNTTIRCPQDWTAEEKLKACF